MRYDRLKKVTYNKLKFYFWTKLVTLFRGLKCYPLLYRSYWHYLIFRRTRKSYDKCYYTARPNPGAGIGHQLANWIAGHKYSKDFDLPFAHWPFNNEDWNNFFGFGEHIICVETLLKKGYKIRKVPYFDEDNNCEKNRIRRIIESYSGKKIIFLAEQDQFYRDLHTERFDLQNMFFSATHRKYDQIKYNENDFNIAIHVRRGDIMTDLDNPNLRMRFIPNDYFEKVLAQVVKFYDDEKRMNKPIKIWFFSQGKPEDFMEFNKFGNIRWCFDMSAIDSFLHMVRADVLITSKSSFSYKPALLNKGIKICPEHFWHGYPTDDLSWIMVSDDGIVKWNR